MWTQYFSVPEHMHDCQPWVAVLLTNRVSAPPFSPISTALDNCNFSHQKVSKSVKKIYTITIRYFPQIYSLDTLSTNSEAVKMLELFSFKAILLRNHRTVLTVHFRSEWFCACVLRVMYTLLCVTCVCITVQQRTRIEWRLTYLYNKLFKMCFLPFNFEHPVI